MRSTRMRAAVVGVLGVAAIALATPASANPTSSPSAPAEGSILSPTPSPTAAATSPSASPTSPTDGLFAPPSPTATATGPADASATPIPGLLASATPSPDASASAATTPTATASPAGGGTGDENLDHFLDLLPFKVPLDKEINGIEDIDLNPLFLTFTCDGTVPSWKLKNTSDKSFGFGWFDTDLKGGILDIGPKQTVDIPSKALAVIGSPWDAQTKLLLVTVPTVGVSNCGGPAPTTPPAGLAIPASLPAAVPAAPAAVPVTPHYTG
ncbi:conserved exported hypothetical protein [Frankia canadensis]|uniref:Secreted protein n=1 Tax=Frankia canadensis TaxID=1836972 RepID=A0A2I2KQU0_9ACTN|nr:hypothetical protein [Frankia canadensis]SNQ48035.1 conserved exported hypothetical protein [Frankia canadensis]SOU55325.1 conserved exported hypothetical protein [Frankia canadensis]